MKNEFMGVLEAKKGDLKMGEKGKIKQSHSRVSGCGSHSGIFNAVIKQGNSFFNKRQGSKILNQVQDDFVLFTTTTSGFTLIELLVVVLIIGILAAVALPQYQFAVAKARYIDIMTEGDSLAKAAQLYILANGEAPTSVDQLDFGNNNYCILSSGGTDGKVKSVHCYSSSSLGANYRNNYEYPYADGLWEGRFCYVAQTNEKGNKLCAMLGTFFAPGNNDNYYKLN